MFNYYTYNYFTSDLIACANKFYWSVRRTSIANMELRKLNTWLKAPVFWCLVWQDSSIDMKGQAVQDLKSRGLCLVPMSFSSYITYSCD